MPVAAVVVPPLEVVPPDLDPVVVEVEPVVVPVVVFPVPVVPVVPVVLVPPVVVVLPVVLLPVVPVVPVVVVVPLPVVPVVFVPVVLVAFVEELVRPDVLPAPPCATLVLARVVVRAPPMEAPVELESSSCSVTVSDFEEPLVLVLEEVPVLVLELPLDCPESELALLFPSAELADPSEGSVVPSQAIASPSNSGMEDNRLSLSRKIMHYSFQ